MENMAKKRSRPRRSFTPEFKAEIVELCQRGDRTVRQVSQDFDLTETAVREWVKQADLDTGSRTDALTSTERDELAQLRRENRRLREDVDILKRATLDSKSQGNTLGRGAVAEALAWPVVQSCGENIEVGLAVEAEVGSFR